MPCKTEGSDTLGWLFGGNRAMIQKKKLKKGTIAMMGRFYRKQKDPIVGFKPSCIRA